MPAECFIYIPTACKAEKGKNKPYGKVMLRKIEYLGIQEI
jgi:hypothetical protein